MKKIGVLTFQRSYNYGAILQAYALQTVLTNMEYDVEFINYFDQENWNMSRSFGKKISIIIWHNFVKTLIAGKTRKERTDEFKTRNLKISKIIFESRFDLERKPPIYDAYITGSDQVWNFRLTNYDSSYYLSFVPNDKPRISYAASFGLSKLPQQDKLPLKSLLEKMNNISVREIEGKRIVEDYSNSTAEIVLDPTLLLNNDDWSKISSERIVKENYILCYYMPGDSHVTESIRILAEKVSMKTGWKIINIGQKEYHKLFWWENSIFNAGPKEFVSLFKNASFIITNSFHGTAFSIIFRKPFYVPINFQIPLEKNLSSRITSLLNILDLNSRIVPTIKVLESDNNYSNIELNIDYTYSEVILIQEQLKSLQFLKNALGEDCK